ncbi:SDR family NAD(P)-dependent oxidoreductase [Cryptosporangium phraense]|uniref:SDR family NAD(P)-dependent oxidoreductase n=1 Tax=Cryptosporangium phraense TaxID=2593070 RepID=A0A545AXK6_9ACTN|nr:SDR family NAD(P)-dependent oxidoreductase [Cryptosporangium phraense]TQS46066.1 SDR family NAD(P)-dependent oxidoreductase [Cryptosporangium phraense]
MSRIFITGSSDGLGLLAGRLLVDQGHRVTLHARTDDRADDARKALPDADAVVVGDVSSVAATRSVAAQVNALGRHDAVIHNVAVGYQEPRRIETTDALAHVFAVNVLAPYLLTALITRPDRLVYLSSGMHRGGRADLVDPQWTDRHWNGSRAYSESKLYDLMLARAVARHWPDVPANAVDPGWVPTRMGGRGAPDDLAQGAETQAWLAVAGPSVTGRYFYHREPHSATPTGPTDEDALLAYCADLTGTPLPA